MDKERIKRALRGCGMITPQQATNIQYDMEGERLKQEASPRVLVLPFTYKGIGFSAIIKECNLVRFSSEEDADYYIAGRIVHAIQMLRRAEQRFSEGGDAMREVDWFDAEMGKECEGLSPKEYAAVFEVWRNKGRPFSVPAEDKVPSDDDVSGEDEK